MIEWMILGGAALVLMFCLLVDNWHKVFWNEDWRHLRLGDDWDKDKSRGRLR